MAQQLQQVGGVNKPAKVDGNRRMSVMPAAPTATQVAARSDQLSKLITTCLAEEPQPALISTIVDQTAKKISVVQPTSGSQVTGTITRTADKVYTDLLKRLDSTQERQLRAGYIELWGIISKDIKSQFQMHLNAEVKQGIGAHCTQVLGAITLALGKVEGELFAADQPMTLTADSFLSAAEALRWDKAVDSHENLYVELVTLNKRFAAMKKQQDAKFKRCDQLQAAISNFEMVIVEKGKMDDAVTAGTCQADFSNYVPAMTTHYVEMVDLGVSPADLTKTFDELNQASDRLQTSTKTTTEAIARHGKAMAESVVAAPHVTTA